MTLKRTESKREEDFNHEEKKGCVENSKGKRERKADKINHIRNEL